MDPAPLAYISTIEQKPTKYWALILIMVGHYSTMVIHWPRKGSENPCRTNEVDMAVIEVKTDFQILINEILVGGSGSGRVNIGYVVMRS